MFKTKITLGINIAFAVQLIKRFNVTRAITANTNMKMQMSVVLVQNISESLDDS